MKTYVLLEHYYNYCDEWESIYGITDDEAYAIVWAEDFPTTETEWRTYKEYEVI